MSRRPLRARDHLLYRGLETFLSAAGRLPLGVTRPLGAQIGAIAMAISARDRRARRSHLRIAFPSLDEASMRALLRSHCPPRREASCRGRVAAAGDPRGGGRAVRDHRLEHLEAPARGRDRGGVDHRPLRNGSSATPGSGLRVSRSRSRSAYARPRLDRIATMLRSRFGPRWCRAARTRAPPVRRARRQPDQRPAHRPGHQGHPGRVRAVFSDAPPGRRPAPLRLALRHGCPVVPIFAHRRNDGRTWRDPPLPAGAAARPQRGTDHRAHRRRKLPPSKRQIGPTRAVGVDAPAVATQPAAAVKQPPAES